MSHNQPSDYPADRWAAMTAEPQTQSGPALIRMDAVQSQPIRWLWEGRIPLGKLTVWTGDPGLGKSFCTIDIAARVSRGMAMPGIPGEKAEPGGVVLLSAEDDLSDTVKPRLEAAGADCSKIHAIQGVWRPGKRTPASFTLADLAALEQAIDRTQDCRLVIIDPVSAFLGTADGNDNGEVRGLLAPLSQLAAERDVAVLVVSHLNKGTGQAVYRTMGSLGFTAAARAVWMVVKDAKDPRRRVVLPVKLNIAPETTGISYAIEGDPPRVVWSTDPVTMTADEALSAHAGDAGERSAVSEARDWLVETLDGGPLPAKKVRTRAEAAGIKDRTLDRAKSATRVESKKIGAHWCWVLPDAASRSAPKCPDGANIAKPAKPSGTGVLGDVGDVEPESPDWAKP